jgi:hypothetical protein
MRNPAHGTFSVNPAGQETKMTENQEDKVHFAEFMVCLRYGEKRLDDYPDDVVKSVVEMFNMSRSDSQARFDKGVLVEQDSPKPGRVAPDFRLALTDRAGNRTGEQIQLSEHLDKPVALIFGSYT